MAVIDGGVSYGCTAALEDKAYGIRLAGMDLAQRVRAGNSLPSTYTIFGQVYPVVQITGVTANGSTNNLTAFNSALGASRGGTDTIVVLPPATGFYSYSNEITLSPNTYLCAYGARVRPSDVSRVSWNLDSNTGIFGLTGWQTYDAITRWIERSEDSSYNSLGSKDGSISNGGADLGSTSCWIQSFGNSNVIVMDTETTGSFDVNLFFGGSTNVLVENNTMTRTHSDGFHFVKVMQQVTVRKNRVYNSGDDSISFVQNQPASGIASNILIEENVVLGSRARGITVIGAHDALVRNNTVMDTNQCAYGVYCTTAHVQNDMIGIKLHNNQAIRCNRIAISDDNQGPLIGLRSTSNYRVIGCETIGNTAYVYNSGIRDDFNVTDTVYSGGSLTNTFTESGNSIVTLVSSE